MEASPSMAISIPAGADGNGDGEPTKGQPILLYAAIAAAVIAVLLVLTKGAK